MTSTPRSRTTRQSEPVLRWIFRRAAKSITCQVEVRADRSYSVYLVPHWDVSSSVAEHFDGAAVALLRHAEIARHLRESGWVLTNRVASARTSRAA